MHDTIDVVYHPEDNLWIASADGITVTGKTHDEALLNWGITYYEQQTSEAHEKIDAVFDKYEAVLTRAKTEPDETIRIDLDKVKSQILQATACFRKEDDAGAFSHLDKATEILKKWLE